MGNSKECKRNRKVKGDRELVWLLFDSPFMTFHGKIFLLVQQLTVLDSAYFVLFLTSKGKKSRKFSFNTVMWCYCVLLSSDRFFQTSPCTIMTQNESVKRFFRTKRSRILKNIFGRVVIWSNGHFSTVLKWFPTTFSRIFLEAWFEKKISVRIGY